MMIETITYTDSDSQFVRIDFDDETPAMFGPAPEYCETWHKQLMVDWLNEGNTINPYQDKVAASAGGNA